MPAPAAGAALPIAAAAAESPASVADEEPPQLRQDSWPVPPEELEAGPDGELASPQSPGAQADGDASPRSVLQVQETFADRHGGVTSAMSA